jgi:opacity protein-like surface antigen
MNQPARAVTVTGSALVLAVALGLVSPVEAQTRSVDVSGGYQFTRVTGENQGTSIPTGWYADVAGPVSSMFSVVAEITGAYKTETESVRISSTVTVNAEASARLHTFMGGVRASGHSTNASVVPFAQVLFGAGNLRASVSASGTGTPALSDSHSETKPAMHLGAGVNLMASKRIGIRAAAAYQRIFLPANEGGGENDFIIQVGVVVPIGR